jgi:hypothetical protein
MSLYRSERKTSCLGEGLVTYLVERRHREAVLLID